MAYHDESQKAIQQGAQWNKVREATSDILHALRSMKFEVPDEGEKVITEKYEKIVQDLSERFANVVDD